MEEVIMANTTEKEIIIDLCKVVLSGNISLEKFYEIWANEYNKNPFYRIIYNDIENAIEHTPGFLFKKGVNHVAWQNSYNYLIIYLDCLLPDYEKNPSELISCRDEILQNGKLTVQRIEERVQKHFK